MNQEDISIQGKRVLILGNWSYKNLGDELILLGEVRLLQKLGKKVVISAYNPEWLQSFFSQFEDLKPITYLHEFPKGIRSFCRYFFTPRVKELKEYTSVDTVIIGGGEVLTEESVSAYWYWNLGLLPFFNKLNKIRIYLFGGIQIPQKKWNLKLFKLLLNYTKAIYARDKESVEELKNFGFKKVSFFMDTSWFAYDWKEVQKLEREEDETKVALINLNKNGDKFYDQLLLECEALLNDGYTLKYVPVSKGTNDVYNDLIYKEKLEKDLLMRLELLDWENDFHSFVQAVKSVDLVVTARLHLFLIASFMGVETKVFPYQKKIFKMKNIIEEEGILESL